MFLSGIDIGGTSIKFGIFDEQLNLLQQWSRPTPKEPAEAAALIAAQTGASVLPVAIATKNQKLRLFRCRIVVHF